MSNAPKWSRDLTKLMNPTAENDWRLLASRLGYSNDDIRGWATQHDPCMALLSEWYATHKTSEASYGVLTALTEMNRMDGVVIVENAMKTAGTYSRKLTFFSNVDSIPALRSMNHRIFSEKMDPPEAMITWFVQSVLE